MKLCTLLLALLVASPVLAADHWVGTWSAAAQATMPGRIDTFHDQSVRLIVHVSAGGHRLRVRLSNTFADTPLVIGSAHVARRASGADALVGTDRVLTFQGKSSIVIPAGSQTFSDPVAIDVPALTDLAVTLFFPEPTPATTSHALALQTNYIAEGDATGAEMFPVTKTLSAWPFLTGVDVSASSKGAAIVAFGSSLTDGDGSTEDTNHRYPDLLARRLTGALGVLNEGVVGNRLLNDSPRSDQSPFGLLLGESGLKRFDRDVLAQSGVKYVLIALGVNDILFPAFPFTPAGEQVSSEQIIHGYRLLIARAHARGVRAIGTTIPPFEGAKFEGFDLDLQFYTPERERTRSAVNEWIRHGGAFDGVVDFDRAVRDPAHPTRLRSEFAAEDHLHVNDAGNVAQAEAIALDLFDGG